MQATMAYSGLVIGMLVCGVGCVLGWQYVLYLPWCIVKRYFFPEFFTPGNELLGKEKLFQDILPKFGACHLQLINLSFFNAFLIWSVVFRFSIVCLIIRKALGFFLLKTEIKGKTFFFLVPLLFVILNF